MQNASLWPQILQTISVIIAAVSFLIGINSWRRTEIGKKKIELAVRTLAAFREVEQAFREIRSPMGYSNEGLSRQPIEGESENDAEIRRRAFVAIERINNRAEKFIAVQNMRYEFEAYFGHESIEQPYRKMLTVRARIIGAAHSLENYWRRQIHTFQTEEQHQEHLDRMGAAEAIFWEDSDDPDPLKPVIAEMMDEVTKVCGQAIEPSRNIKEWITRRWREFRRFWLCRTD
ncbi:hypothetical protein [Rhizobium sp.]|uniref:hypothetical protein n=1 Tax=Rhizobium sp. TaxID=391 RepID=UPI0034C5C77D